MNPLYRLLPSVDKILSTPQGELLIDRFGHSAVVNQLRSLLQQARLHIQQQQQLPRYFSDFSVLYKKLSHDLQLQRQVAIKKVHNLTGTVLHTNLGRALWGEAAQQAALAAMRENVALEFDLQQGKRSHRDNFISELLAQLCGAQAACIVNNNAAAVLLLLATFASGKEVIISRGELIEIGGAFRIPDIMQQAGCKLVEVGTTNRTCLADYRHNITENTALLMKVHCSNYQICGFTASVAEAELAQLARQHGLPLISDLGSGALLDLSRYGLPAEPTPQKMLADGVDLVSFSGDKLLGGPQAGIIVGSKALIDRLQQHPLKRVLRCDKVILAGLEATLRDYLFADTLTTTNPTLRLLTQNLDELQQVAELLLQKLQEKLSADYQLQIESSSAQIGSGSQPLHRIPSLAVTLQPHSGKNEELMQLIRSLKQLSQPIIGRIEQQKLWLDLRSVANPQQLLTILDEL
ncbi:L-seryl-tRNA(Sec) selenium transferase [Testudinibacter aquarius]|nr:L-seryl-tRNA(Sec) selenium transferase [Testudinibacter aquarius]TNG93811.1 L-seryl-tRNA(Sec) selenium transferase [Pasteurellaceae bacterium UScroc12]TNG95533.1 L-seryl-tRNA(Sec) selenium transferase [Pasteurellaceae bacterium USgator41]TNG99546.1 L-seryl-tRNA(Sec) selenium transferase [Pasteurellaceae bacterium USgator11]TNH00099.1 L-seryl-tRNA(Sec) selenium transferase [Pasteurellaceae bacterium UScroc31]KAE9527556.1 L-seryl-tRNA(Sec) selenium transferase [Testudinibacter aquarius]